MKKIIVGLLAVLLLSACDEGSEPDNTNTEQIKVTVYMDEINRLNDILKEHEDPAQIFKINADKPTRVRGNKGTVLYVNPADLETEDGMPVKGEVKVELKELTNSYELLRANAQTVTYGRLLISGGAYYINMTGDGKQLKLKSGKSLNMELPKLAKGDMGLYYGERDNNGSMNWKEADETLKEKKEKAVKEDKSERTTAEWGERSDIDKIIEYANDSEGEWGTDTTYKENLKVYEQVSKAYTLAIKDFGWVNVDRLWKATTTGITLSFNKQDTFSAAHVFYMYEDENVLIDKFYWYGEPSTTDTIPAGYRVTVLVLAATKEQTFAYTQKIKTGDTDTLHVNLKPVTDTELGSILNGGM